MQTDFLYSEGHAGDTDAWRAVRRYDLYGPIHKGLRAFMQATLVRVGNIDVTDPVNVGETLEQVRSLMALLQAHLEHENRFVHTAIEARRKGGSARTGGDHEEHERTIADTLAWVGELGVAAYAGQVAAADQIARGLYLRLSCFIAENLEHMHFEETENQALLWSLYTDAELQQIEAAIVASEPSEESSMVLRWMLPALTPEERLRIVGGARLGMPAPAFEGFLAMVRGILSASDYDKLSKSLGAVERSS